MFRPSGHGSDALPRNGNVQFETNLSSRANSRFCPLYARSFRHGFCSWYGAVTETVIPPDH
jgi:hypothetical protein